MVSIYMHCIFLNLYTLPTASSISSLALVAAAAVFQSTSPPLLTIPNLVPAASRTTIPLSSFRASSLPLMSVRAEN